MLIDPNDPMMSAPAVPAGTLRRFTERLPELQALVSQALSIDARAGANGARPEQLGFILDLQPYIGLTLAAVYQFGIYGILAEEAADLARVCTGRGLDARFLVRMVQTWEIALHAALRTPDVSDLVRPLQWLESLVKPLFAGMHRDDPAMDTEQIGFMAALIENRRSDALDLARQAQKRRSLDGVIDRFLMPALAGIGRRWSDGAITVADEHLATANASWVAGRLLAECRSERPRDRRDRMVAVTCVAGDSHVFGAELLAQYLDGDGWTSLFLGASMPQRDLLEMIAGKRPYAAIVSIRMAAFLPAFKDLADALRGTVPAMLLLAGGTPRIAPVLTRLCDGVPATFAEAQAMLEKGPHRA